MSVFLTRPSWQSCLKNYEITDVAIRDRNIVYVGAKRKLLKSEIGMLLDEQITSRIVGLYLDEPPGEEQSFDEITGMRMPVVGVARDAYQRQCGLFASKDKDGDVWPMGGGSNGPFEKIDPGAWPSPSRLKCINGYTYSVGWGRAIYKRVAVGKWELFGEFAKPARVMHAGFEDLDAISETEMYAVGGHGDVWYFNGTQWLQMGFPTNEQLGTVTCAGDGNVYITSEGGSLWVGERSTWKLLEKRSASILWNDALWFNNQLWLSSDYQLRVWNGKSMEPVQHEGQSVSARGHMDAYDGLLAIASLEFVWTFDGSQWQTVVAPYLD